MKRLGFYVRFCGTPLEGYAYERLIVDNEMRYRVQWNGDNLQDSRLYRENELENCERQSSDSPRYEISQNRDRWRTEHTKLKEERH